MLHFTERHNTPVAVENALTGRIRCELFCCASVPLHADAHGVFNIVFQVAPGILGLHWT